MNVPFLIAAGVALFSTVLVILSPNAVHALLYLIISLLAVAVVFLLMGAPFIAALEVIIYAGAIVVLFLFVVMMLNLGPGATEEEKRRMPPRSWLAPGLLAMLVLALVTALYRQGAPVPVVPVEVSPREVGLALFGRYLVAVQLAALLLLAGLIGASHLRRRELLPEPEEEPGERREGKP